MKDGNQRLPTSTVTPARLRLCQPTQRPTYRTGEWIVTPWGRCQVTGRFGQRHQDLLDAFLWHAEKARQIEDGGIEILVDPAKVRKTMSDARHSLSGLQKLIRELREVTLEIKTPKLMIMGGLVDHVVKSPVTRPDPMNGGERHLWRVRIGLALAELLRNDLPLHYDPTPITRLQNGITQAIARYILSHTSEPNGGWILDNAIRAVAGGLSAVSIRHRRHEIRLDEDGLAVMGIIIDGERLHRRTAKACSIRPVEFKKTSKCAAPARFFRILQDPFRRITSIRLKGQHLPRRLRRRPPGVFFPAGRRVDMGATMQRGNGHGAGRRFGQSVCAEGVLTTGRMDIARHFAPLRDGRSSRSAVRCLFQNLRRPLIETFPGRLSSDEHRAMDFRRHPEHEVSRGGFFWRNALGCAILQIIIHCSVELGAQFGDRFSVKTDDGAHPEYAPNKNAVAFVEIDSGSISLVRHGIHGFTPTRSKSSLASSTGYFFASFPGCGR